MSGPNTRGTKAPGLVNPSSSRWRLRSLRPIFSYTTTSGILLTSLLSSVTTGGRLGSTVEARGGGAWNSRRDKEEDVEVDTIDLVTECRPVKSWDGFTSTLDLMKKIGSEAVVFCPFSIAHNGNWEDGYDIASDGVSILCGRREEWASSNGVEIGGGMELSGPLDSGGNLGRGSDGGGRKDRHQRRQRRDLHEIEYPSTNDLESLTGDDIYNGLYARQRVDNNRAVVVGGDSSRAGLSACVVSGTARHLNVIGDGITIAGFTFSESLHGAITVDLGAKGTTISDCIFRDNVHIGGAYGDGGAGEGGGCI